jgi:hypothetical protein
MLSDKSTDLFCKKPLCQSRGSSRQCRYGHALAPQFELLRDPAHQTARQCDVLQLILECCTKGTQWRYLCAAKAEAKPRPASALRARRWNIAEFHVVSGHESDLQPSDCWQRPLISEIGHARGGPLARLLLLTCGLLAHRVGAMREQVSPSAYHWCACGARPAAACRSEHPSPAEAVVSCDCCAAGSDVMMLTGGSRKGTESCSAVWPPPNLRRGCIEASIQKEKPRYARGTMIRSESFQQNTRSRARIGCAVVDALTTMGWLGQLRTLRRFLEKPHHCCLQDDSERCASDDPARFSARASTGAC